MLFYYLGFVIMVVFILQAVAFLTLLERHFLGGSQCRIGPNKVSMGGVLQALFDGVKLMKKEQIFILSSNSIFFFFVPCFGFIMMVLFWFSLPYFFFFWFLLFRDFFVMFVGFFRFSHYIIRDFKRSLYSFLGGVRAWSPSFSLEISFSFFLLFFIFINGSLSLNYNFNFLLLFILLPFFILVLMDLHRAPFDFSEGEGELVSGFNVEYTSVSFAILFLSEYGNLIFFSILIPVFFFNFNLFFTYFFISIIIFCRSAYPRYRFDKLMGICWYDFFPFGAYLLFFFIFGFF
uniref:NADH-ubiquinone oxidoreductase chain 1 n=1 Tax=Heliconema longissimum TaxID=657295 RepID=G4V232_9BILA|nr:NADH dehydrogenase subunit 1 [Heliconema longissimum]AEK94062.1 NADH dehydrogenase subunit 1 [Heliconema longissimum]